MEGVGELELSATKVRISNIRAMEPKEYFMVVGFLFLCFFGVPIRITDDSVVYEKRLFEDYIKNFNKSYDENDSEYSIKFHNFRTSLKLIKDLNKKRLNNKSALYGLTEFSDLSKDEFIRTKLQKAIFNKFPEKYVRYRQYTAHDIKESYTEREKRSVALPLRVDWREKGIIGDIHNQKTCGACWAFSTIETAESMNALKVGSLVELSVQEAVDCARYGNFGCEGGDSCSLLNWLVATKMKITTEKLYPFIFKTGTCKAKKPKTGVQIQNFSCENFVGSEDELQKKIAFHGPVSAAVNAVNWQYYLGGIIQYHCTGAPHDLNHAVQIVGYDKTGPVPFYIARNSWGPDFGDKGYVYIAIGGNLCGLATEVTFLDVV